MNIARKDNSITIIICIILVLFGGFLFKNNSYFDSVFITYIMWGFGVGFATVGSNIIIKLLLKKYLPNHINVNVIKN
jgi:hypothetical protein